MPFEEDRLRILERVSHGELSPQEGSLEIAMLRMKYERDDAAVEPSAPSGSRRAEDAWAAWRERFAPPDARVSRWRLVVALALPLAIALGFVLSFLAFLLALPTLLLVAGWNALVASSVPGAGELAYWPTLALAVLLFALWSALRWRTRLRAWVGRP